MDIDKMLVRFEAKYVKSPSGCWEWVGAKHERGYGYFYTHPDFSDRKMDYTHRVSLFLYNGMKPNSNDCVLHKCDNPSCVNPDHLMIGTHKDNMLDMVGKSRFISPRQRYTEADCQMAMKMRDAGFKIKDIALFFKCDRSHASRMSRGLIRQFNKFIKEW